MEKKMIMEADSLANIGHWFYDIQKDIFHCSDEILHQHKIDYQPTLEEAVDFIKEGYHRTKFRKLLNKAIKNGEAFETEVVTVHSDGEEQWSRIWGTANLKNGKPIELYGGAEDITQRKSRLDRLSKIARETQNTVIITGPDRKIRWVNRAFVSLTGYSREEVIGRNPGDFLQGKDTDPETVERMRRELDAGHTFSTEVINYNKSGEPYWTKIDMSPIRDEEGTIVEYFSIQEDITEEKRIQKELADQKKRLLFAQEIGAIGDWDFAADTKKVTWSPMMYTIFECPEKPDPPDFETFLNFFKDEAEILRSAFQAAIKKKESFRFDLEIETGKSETKYVHIEGVPTINDEEEVIKLHGIVQNITNRKIAENQLAYKEKQLRTIINNINGVLLRYQKQPDGKDKVIYVSEGTEDLYGVKREDLMQSTNVVWDLIHEEDIEQTRNMVLSSGNELKMWDQIFRIITPDGVIKWLHGRGVPENLENGIVQWDTLITDVTESIRKEKVNEALIQEIHHRVKNNLAIIIALLQMQLLKLNNNNDSRLPLERAITRIHSLAQVHELLYQQSNFAFIDPKIYFEKLVEKTLETIDTNAEVESSIEVDDIRMNVNELSPLGLLLNELLVNSMKFAFIEIEKGLISITLNLEDNHYKLVYTDNGPGVSLERFENAESAGFRIIHVLLKQLDARYKLRSNPGFGLEISFQQVDRGPHSAF